MDYEPMNNGDDSEEAARARRRKRIEEAKRLKRRQMLIRRLVRRFAVPAAGVLLLLLVVMIGIGIFRKPDNDKVEAGVEQSEKVRNLNTEEIPEMEIQEEGSTQPPEEETAQEEEEPHVYSAKATDATKPLGGDIISSHAVLIDVAKGEILAQKDAKTMISPASMTKILTVLVAAEHVDNLDDTFTITRDITDFSYVNDCSNVGFEENETVTVKDLFYGTILPSGADAAVGLAVYVAGSQEAFVDMMNDKLEELGLSDTAHFTNCVGVYDTQHYCTVYDMAMILEAAVNNDLCKEVLSAHTYTTSRTEQHPEGLTISNWFLRRIEDKDSGGEVLCGKTGYVVQSGNCAASYADGAGRELICVTAAANSGWRCIYDHVAIYKQFFG